MLIKIPFKSDPERREIIPDGMEAFPCICRWTDLDWYEDKTIPWHWHTELEINWVESGTLAPLLKRLQKAGYINRVRPENNERKLFLSLTEEGEALKERARNVPLAMQGCIPLPEDELRMFRDILNRALAGMDEKGKPA